MTSLQEETEKCDLTYRSQQVTRDLLMVRKCPPSTFYTVSNSITLETPCLCGIGLPDKDIRLIKISSEEMSYLLN